MHAEGNNTQRPASGSLRDALQAAGIGIPEERLPLLERYVQLLWSWSKRINLTRHLTYELFVCRDVVDATEAARCLEHGETVLDVGTGGGLPGVLIALLREDLQVFLCDSVEKKARAVAEIAHQLALPVTVLAGRGEQIVRFVPFDTLTARAVAPLERLLGWFSGRSATYKRLLVFKGPTWKQELEKARRNSRLKNFSFKLAAKYRSPSRTTVHAILEFRPLSARAAYGSRPEELASVEGPHPYKVLYRPEPVR